MQPLDFWRTFLGHFPVLLKVARRVLDLRAGTRCVESHFSVTPGSKTLNSRILGARWHAVKAGMPRVEMSLHRRPYVEFQNRPYFTIRETLPCVAGASTGARPGNVPRYLGGIFRGVLRGESDPRARFVDLRLRANFPRTCFYGLFFVFIDYF